MRRFFRLYKTFVVQYFKQLMEYRIDFLTGALSFLINQLTNILFISIIFDNISALSGYSRYEIYFIYGFSLLPKGLDHLLTDNLWKVAYFIVRKGDFDKYLTRPINPLLHVIMELFQFDALGEFVTGIVLLSYASVKLGIHFGPVQILILLVAIIVGTLIFTSIKILFAALALWIKRSGSILQIFYMSSDFARYPVTIYSKPIRFIITYIIPYGFTAYYPSTYFLRGNSPLFALGAGAIAAAILLTVSITVWNRGLSAYESAGS